MLILLSPAKSLDFDTQAPATKCSEPALLEGSQELVQGLRKLGPSGLKSLMSISDSLADLNAARFADWQPTCHLGPCKQAMFAFTGDVYQGLDATSLGKDDIDQAQDRLRILSGLYGVLRPLDLIRPYRLEMGSRYANPRGKDLYAYWGDEITEQLNTALAALGADRVVNLASNEYFRAVRPKQLAAEVISPVFKDLKNGAYKVVSFYAKRARGAMARFLIQQRVRAPEGMAAFDWAGYRYVPDVSTPAQPVFLRDAPP
ncbi:MAG: peroxide stress protein YaaA [Pseudomonadota bacterium]|nr:peroxide stress protein YaaA [Pseudomonadota bacterium]